jgi:hypothetical protein
MDRSRPSSRGVAVMLVALVLGAAACAADLRGPVVAEAIGRRPQGVYLVLSRVSWCSVETQPGTRIVSYTDAARASCRLTPFDAQLEVHLRAGFAEPSVRIGRVDADLGRVRLATGDLVAMAKRQQRLPWSRAAVLELVDAAGHVVARVDLEPLRARLADGHADAVLRGRGDARLAASDLVGHPSAPRIQSAAARETAARRAGALGQ